MTRKPRERRNTQTKKFKKCLLKRGRKWQAYKELRKWMPMQMKSLFHKQQKRGKNPILLPESATQERPNTTLLTEATYVAVSRSLIEKEALLHQQHEELERLKKQVKRLSREPAAALPAFPSAPKTPVNQVQSTLFAPRNGDLWSVSF